MNRKLCAPADRAQSWETIDWKKAEAYVKKLQPLSQKVSNFVSVYVK